VVEIDRDAIEAANDATYAAWNAHDPDAPTARKISVEGCTFSTFGPDGLVVRDVNFLDVATLLGQLSGQ
jgi:hypothetical protein